MPHFLITALRIARHGKPMAALAGTAVDDLGGAGEGLGTPAEGGYDRRQTGR
jgi:hypothetical protein